MAARIEKFDPAQVYPRHPKAYPQGFPSLSPHFLITFPGGVHLKEDPNSTVNTRDVIINIIKSVGGKVNNKLVIEILLTLFIA